MLRDWNKMKIVIGYNKSDATYGWHGSSQGYVLYFSHFSGHHVRQDNSIPLSSGVAPVVTFKTVKRNYLGHPFTNCNNNSHAVNDFGNWKIYDGKDYSQRFDIIAYLGPWSPGDLAENLLTAFIQSVYDKGMDPENRNQMSMLSQLYSPRWYGITLRPRPKI